MSNQQTTNSENGEGNENRGIILAATFLGLLIGAAGTFAGIYGLGYRVEKPVEPVAVAQTNSSTPPAGGTAPVGPPMMGGGGMGGGGMGGMGMGGMGMGGGIGGGGAQGKRNLTQLVGKLELLTRGKLDVAFTPEQTDKMSALLSQISQAEKMTADEAQSHLESLEGVLTPEQKEIVDSIGLPFGGRGGRGAGGRPGGGGGGRGGPGGGMGGGMGGMGGMMGGGGAPDDENPFKQEANEKRLTDFLNRIKPGDTKSAESAK